MRTFHRRCSRSARSLAYRNTERYSLDHARNKLTRRIYICVSTTCCMAALLLLLLDGIGTPHPYAAARLLSPEQTLGASNTKPSTKSLVLRDYHGRGTSQRRRQLLRHALQQHWVRQVRVSGYYDETNSTIEWNDRTLASLFSSKDADEINQIINHTSLSKSESSFLHHVHHTLSTYLHPEVFRHTDFALLDKSHSLHQAFPPFPDSLRRRQRARVRDMFRTAYDAYMSVAFPAGELKPLSCTAGEFDPIRLPALTLIDTLDTLILLQNYTEFARAVERIRQLHSQQDLFAVDENVSVFETNIRVLGGLLSAHQMALAFVTDKVERRSVFDSNGVIKWGYNEDKHDDGVCERVVRYNEDQFCSDPHEHSSHCDSITSSISSITSLLNSGSKSLSWEDPFSQICLLPETTVRRRKSVSSYINCTQQNSKNILMWVYDGFLLEIAHDLGLRLLPAFDTKTGIPFGTVNLLHGVPRGETTVASLAGGGTLSLEMELLSRLTNDERFGKAAKLAMRALFIRRSHLDLLGKHVDIQQGQWTETLSGIGSNSDSFLEYIVKHYLLFPEDDDMWNMLLPLYTGVFNHSRAGEWYVDVDMMQGTQRGHSRRILESLMAFYPGLQVLLGELAPAAKSLNSFFMVREWLGFLPERFHFGNWKVDMGRGAGKHPLRPELIESCYLMHRAYTSLNAGLGRASRRSRQRKKDSTERSDGNISTLDDSSGWLWAASFAVDKIESVTQAPCGFAGIKDLSPLTTGGVGSTFSATTSTTSMAGDRSKSFNLMDEMPSFFLSETLKYLYLMFDEENILHQDDDRQWIFTTEAHPLHFVPRGNKNVVHCKSKRLIRQVNNLKKMLHQRLDENRIQQTSFFKESASLIEEKWVERSTLHQYRRQVDSAMSDVHAHRNLVADQNSDSDINKDFFVDRSILAPFVPGIGILEPSLTEDLRQDQNMAHLALAHLGIGPASLFRKACANIYSSSLLWMHALNGGALDYSDTYVTVLKDEMRDHPNYFVVVGAAQALGMHGSGVFLDKNDEEGLLCEILDKTDRTRGQVVGRPDSEDETEVQTKLFEIASDMGTFQISPFAGRDGFFLQHTESGETLVVTFIQSASTKGTELVMTYYAIPILDKEIKADDDVVSKRESTLRKLGTRLKSMFMHKSRKAENAELDEFLERKVVVSDFEGNSFHCEVELVEKYKNESEEPVEILTKYPCAPAMFGPTDLMFLRENDGICIEAKAHHPPENDEVGCSQLNSNADDAANFVGMGNSRTEDAHVIQIVRRGDCSFYSKAVNQRWQRNADAVIIINTEDTELFVMSSGNDDEIIEDPENIPTTVLLTGLDGENLLQKLNTVGNEGENAVAVRLSISRQKGLGSRTANEETHWPVVNGFPEFIQVYAKSGWGMQAKKREKIGDWQLQLLRHDFSKS